MKRPRIGIRLMLLVVALFATVFAWIGAMRQMHQQRLRTELDDLRHVRRYVEINRENFTSDEAWQSRMNEVNAKISKAQQKLGN